jgi:hypothetical protein
MSGGSVAVSCPVQTFVVAAPRVDLDGDGDVDYTDSSRFVGCLTGPGVSYEPIALPAGCSLQADEDGRIGADPDRDGDVDQDDFGILQRCYSGPGKPADPNCEP